MPTPPATPNGLGSDLASARRTPFPRALARDYERDTGPERARIIRTRGLIGLALYLGYLGIDWLLTPDVFHLALVLRLLVVAPLALAALAMVTPRAGALRREALPALICVLGGVATIAVMLASHSPLREYHHYSLLLLIAYFSVVLPIRAVYAASASGLLLAIDFLSFRLLPAAKPALAESELAILSAAAALLVFAGFSFERNMRLAYRMGQQQLARGEALEDLSRRDPLTGLGNRRRLDEIATALNRSASDVAVVIADIDHFKAYNDSLGHPAGDRCLIRIAGLLAAELRGGADTAIRLGGEEFLLVLPDTDLWTAIAIAERVRASIAGTAIPHPGRPLKGVVSASFGVAAGRTGPGTSFEEIIAGADAALYTAKNAGRDQVWPAPRSGSDVVPLARRSGAA